MTTKNIQPKLRKKIEEVIGKKDNYGPANLLALHLEEIYDESKNISSLIEKILKEKIPANKLETTLIEIKVGGGDHLKDHLVEMKRSNEKVLAKLDHIIRPKSKWIKLLLRYPTNLIFMKK